MEQAQWFVLLFPGDALLALWKVERCHLNEIITLALKCSFSIQQEYGVRDTEVGLELRVKIGTTPESRTNLEPIFYRKVIKQYVC